MIYKNAEVFYEGRFQIKDVRVEAGVITAIGALCERSETTVSGALDKESKVTAIGALDGISKAMATEALDKASKTTAIGASDKASEIIATGALDDASKTTVIGALDKTSEIIVTERLEIQEDSVDLTGYRLIPGVIDVHTHGCLGYDFSHITAEGIAKMEAYYKQQGVTSILATVMTSEPTQLMEAVRVMREYQRATPQTIIKGIHLEGPFYGESKKGAHESRYLKKIDEAWFEHLDAVAEGQIKLVSIDPTLEGASDFIRHYKDRKTIALGHTDATYAQAKEAVACGARQITHLFNAMNGLHHREPGLFGVLTDEEVYAELITDGVHVHPSIVKMCFNANPEKLLIISDSISAAGLKEGERCISGGVEVVIKEGKAITQEGTLAGSTYTGYEVMRQAIQFGVNETQAIQSASQYPAQAVGLEKVGKIDIGYHADLLIVDQDYNLKTVIQAGECENKTVF